MRLDHRTVTLDNGLRVLLLPDASLPKVVVDLWYDVGSYDDPPGRSGFAHLFEHLMFKGTSRVGEGQFDVLMEGAGGANNASTGDERTNYYAHGPKGALELLLWLEADRMTGLDITQQKLDVEREVVRNERRQNYEDAPYGKTWLELPRLLYPPDHPMSRNGIGEHADLLAADLGDVRAFYERWYVPSNATLAVAGDFDPEATLAYIRATFGALPSRPCPVRGPVIVPTRPHRRSLQLTDDVALPATIRAWHTPALYAPLDGELDLVAALLSGSDDGRLPKRLIYDERSAQSVDATQISGRWGSLFVIEAHAAPGHTLAELDAAIDEELAALLGDRPSTDDELERGVNNREVDKLYGLEGLLGRAELAQSYLMHLGRVDGIDVDLNRYRQATHATLREAAAHLTPERGVRLHVLPEAS